MYYPTEKPYPAGLCIMPTLITAGIDYPQFFDDLRAVIRHELQSHAPAAPVGNAAPADELLSIREAATLLGVTVQTCHEWKRRGMLEVVG